MTPAPEHKALLERMQRLSKFYLVQDGMVAQETQVVLTEAADAIEALAANAVTLKHLNSVAVARAEAAEAKLAAVLEVLELALADLKGTYCHVSSVSADRIKSITIPRLEAALTPKPKDTP